MQTTYTYKAFGATTVTGESKTSVYGYTGRENDGTGLYYYRARYYHPALARFISEDPTEFNGTMNLYLYVGGDPISYVDPLGLYQLKPDIPPPRNPRLIRMLTCMDGCLHYDVYVTSTHEKARPRSAAHRDGVAVDVAYPTDPQRLLCCAKRCGAATARDEVKNPLPGHTKGANIHISLRPGFPTNPGGPTGDLPSTICGCR